MTSFLLHVGSSKTGSTAIQNTLLSCSTQLHPLGLHYPRLGNKSDHSILVPAVLEDDEYLHNFSRRDPEKRLAGVQESETAWTDLSREVSRSSGKTVIISTEYAFGLRPRSVERLICRLSALAADIKIASYLRDPCEHYLSAAQQILKYGAQVKDPRTPQNYCAKLRKFDRLLPGKVAKRIFHREWLFQRDVTLDLLSLVAPKQAIINSRITTASYNSSISAEAMALLQRFNTCTWGEHRQVGNALNKKLLRLIEDEESRDAYTKPALLPDIRHAVTLSNARDVIELRDTHGLSFPNFDYDHAESASEESLAEVEAKDALGTLSVADIVGLNERLVERMTMRTMSRIILNWQG